MNRISERDLQAQVERLNRNLKGKLDVSVVHQNGYINLFSGDHSKDYSLGNTKSELYYQMNLVNKIIEEMERA